MSFDKYGILEIAAIKYSKKNSNFTKGFFHKMLKGMCKNKKFLDRHALSLEDYFYKNINAVPYEFIYEKFWEVNFKIFKQCY